MTKRKGGNVKADKQTITKGDVGTAKASDLVPKAAAPSPAKPVIKVLKKDMKYKGARDAWYGRLIEFEGKTLDEFYANTKEKPPALTRNQTAENPTGWVGFFKREGVMTLTAPN